MAAPERPPSPSRLTPRTVQAWGAVLPQVIGLAGVCFCAVYWAIFRALAPELLTAFGAMIVVGQSAARIAEAKEPPPPAPSELEAEDERASQLVEKGSA